MVYFSVCGVWGDQRRASVILVGIANIEVTEFSVSYARASWGFSLASWGITAMSEYWIDAISERFYKRRNTKRSKRPKCGAKCRDGHACRAPAVWDKQQNCPRNGRCKLHGGKSTGPRTPEGKARIAEAQRERWRKWRMSLNKIDERQAEGGRVE